MGSRNNFAGKRIIVCTFVHYVSSAARNLNSPRCILQAVIILRMVELVVSIGDGPGAHVDIILYI